MKKVDNVPPVAGAMGLENIDFIWYMKKISLLALSGYMGGAIVFCLMFGLS